MYMVRGTELNDFLRCRLKWKYTWIDQLKSKKENDKLLAGTLMHKFLETWYNTHSIEQAHMAMDDLAAQTGEIDDLTWEDISVTLAHTTVNYVEKYKDDLDSWDVIATELTFAIPLDDEIGYTGTIDLIIRNKQDGKIYFADHKYTKSLDRYDQASSMDRQISRYWWALQQLQQGNGEYLHKELGQWFMCRDKLMADLQGEIGGFIYNLILKDYPRPPRVLKNGSLSKDKSQNTTLQLYVKELQERNLLQQVKEGWVAPDEYKEILDHLRENPREYFRRLPVIRNQQEINAAIEELYATALDMSPREYTLYAGHRPLPKIYRNITHDCSWDCQFLDVCRATLDGSNADYLIEQLFTKREETGNGIRNRKASTGS